MKLCTHCITPDTRPHIVFNEEGVCDACLTSERKHKGIDWDQRRKELEVILEKYRSKDGKNWDCIIPVSGGKDSMYQTYMMKKVFNMNPLAVTFAQCDCTSMGMRNLQSLREIGVDHILFTSNPITYKKIFKEAFTMLGDPCWPCHAGISTFPVQMAVKFNIPLLVWGENTLMEYGGPRQFRGVSKFDRKLQEEFCLKSCSPHEMARDGITLADMKPYIYPSNEEIQQVDINGLYLGYFIKWDARSHVETAKQCGFQPRPDGPYQGAYLDYENVDCGYIEIHDYLMFLKYGYGRATTQISIDIRNGRITRYEGLRLVEQYEGITPITGIENFCKFTGISKKEFWKNAWSFTNKMLFEPDEEGYPRFKNARS